MPCPSTHNQEQQMMAFQDDPSAIKWRLHLVSPPEKIYGLLSTGIGRAQFWAESAEEEAGSINFLFPNGERWRGRILETIPDKLFRVEYYGGSVVTFDLESDGSVGTDFTLTDEGVPAAHRSEVIAGWLSVLMALRAAVDFSVDLRNHDPNRTWDQGFADN
jgi:uncharacterized protein YndB with AHSA1/START domain